MLAAMLLLARWLGPTQQGVFSKVKAEVEFIAALAMLGLPQALFFFVQAGQMSLVTARRWSGTAGGTAAAAGAIYCMAATGDDLVNALSMSLAGAAFAWHGCLRGVVLASSGTRTFNVTTALPQFLLLGFAMGAVANGGISRTSAALAFAVAFVAAALLGFRGDGRVVPPKSPPKRDVVAFGLASGVASLGMPAATFLLVHAVERDLGASSLGVFTLALTIAQGVLVPLNYAIPLLFKRWMEQPSESNPHRIGVSAAVIMVSIAALMTLLGQTSGIERWFGRYVELSTLLPILLLAASADAYQRMLAVDSNARGAPRIPAFAEAVRVIVIAGGTFSGIAGGPPGFGLVVVGGSLACLTSQIVLHSRLSERKT